MDSGYKPNIKWVSYICNSLRQKVYVIRDLLHTCDILLCQEVILLAEGYCLLEGISDLFNF